MIYFSPEIIGCRILLIEQRVYGENSWRWKQFDPPEEGGIVIGYSKKDDSGSITFNLTCLCNDNLIKAYQIGYAQNENIISIHPDDAPYFRKK